MKQQNQKAIDRVNQMIERWFGHNVTNWFNLSISGSNACNDYYIIKSENNKIAVRANNGVSLAAGVYYYLREFCHIIITHHTSNINLPDSPIKLEKEIHNITSLKQRYAYNYCTHSYTMSFWGEKEWQRELDFLAFHGINLVLDITGEEKVWFEFFKRIGYSEKNARKNLVGPTYWAWFCMANMYNYDGNLSDEYLQQRVNLAKKNHQFMLDLGMKPVLMGYCGMVPDDIKNIDKNAKVIPQGKWNQFSRPAMLKTNRSCYKKYADIFYSVQKEIFGDITNYFSTDPFHEGGVRGCLSNYTVGKHILHSMLKQNKNNIWVIQSWGSNPTKGQLKSLRYHKDNALILDLYAEKKPRFKNFRKSEFYNTPWIYCMLDNFGGRMGLHGHIDKINNDLPQAINPASHIKGVGITPEALDTNGILTEFLFDVIWYDKNDTAKSYDLNQWTSKYLLARYGKKSEKAEKAFDILLKTVYCDKFNQIGEGAPESIVNARPNFKIKSASNWGNSVISYDKKLLEKAYKLLIADYDVLKESDAYIYDVIDVHKQILSNKALDIHSDMVNAYNSKDINNFIIKGDEFLTNILEIDKTLDKHKEFRLSTWLDMAKNVSKNLSSQEQQLFVTDAKKIITTWGDESHSEKGKLHDYSNRQWSGLTKDLYYKRWKLWIDNRTKELNGETVEKENFYEMEKEFVCSVK